MVAIAAKPAMPEPEFSAGALRECGGLRIVARVMWTARIAPLLDAEDFGDVPAEVAVSNGRAIATGNGVVFAAYRIFGTKAMADVTMHVVWTIGRNPSICVRLASESISAG